MGYIFLNKCTMKQLTLTQPVNLTITIVMDTSNENEQTYNAYICSFE